jgi:predicted O-linked N-acetylglucosamine transferase (SPINDLY family)
MSMHTNHAQALSDAVAAHRDGRPSDAERGYRSILAVSPAHFDAMQLLGALLAEAGRVADGIALMRRAIQVRPDHAGTHRNLSRALLGAGLAAEGLVAAEAACAIAPVHAGNQHARGNALAALGRDAEAIDAQVAAIRAEPGHRDAWYNLGLALLGAGRADEALSSLDHAIMLGGDDARLADCEASRATAMRALGRLEDAILAATRATTLRPGDGAKSRNLSILLEEAGRHEECLGACDAALVVEPGHAETLHRRGAMLARLGRKEEAAGSLLAAIAAEPRSARYRCNAGLVLHELGRARDALACFEAAIDIDPLAAAAHHGRGLALHELGRAAEAVAAYDAAIAIDPASAEAFSNRGNALHDCRRDEEALASYGRALALDPAYADAHFNRAIALEALARPAEALAAYDAAIAANPSHARAFCNRGNVLARLARNEEALESYDRAIVRDPGLAEAHNNRGVLLRTLRRHAEAAESYRRALALRPAYAETWNNLGTALAALGAHEEAIAAYDQAVRLRPDYADALSNRGCAFMSMKALQDALSSFDRAIAIRPGHADAWYNRANALQDHNHFIDAIASYDQALAIAPGHANALNNRAKALLDMRQVDAALADFGHSVALLRGDWDKRSNLLFTMNYSSTLSPGEIAQAHRAFGQELAAATHAAGRRRHVAGPRRRLRVGYVSGDFRQHSVGYFLEGVLAAHATRAQVDVFAYANQETSDLATARMKRSVQGWRDIAFMSDEDAHAAIEADGIDILVDLTGHSARSRLPLFARRPAPVQASWIGYPQTTGLEAIDWIIADPTVLPPEDEHLYVERPMRLDGCYLCYSAPRIEPSPLPALARGHVTFGCFNVLKKIADPVLSAWAEILGRTPGARILVKTHAVGDARVAEDFRKAFAALGGDASRLDLEGRLPTDAHRRRFADIDIMLDPFPYNGCTSTAEALNAGVPVVALRGRGGMMTRSGETLLKAAGLQDWVADDVGAYVDIAVARALDPDALAALRARVGVAGFSDNAAFAIQLEDAYRRMWEDWRERDPIAAGQPPRMTVGVRG